MLVPPSGVTFDQAGRILTQGPPAPAEVWQVEAGDTVMSNPVLADSDTLLVATRYGDALALDARTGQQKWAVPSDNDILTDMALGPDEAVYLARSPDKVGASGTVTALDVHDGSVRWSSPVEGIPGRAFARGPEHSLYLGTSVFQPTGPNTAVGAHGFLFALDDRGGQEKWRFKAESGVVGAPVYKDGLVLVGSYDNNFYGLDARTGEQRWVQPTDGWISSTPVVGATQVYFGSWDKKLYACDAASGELAWELDTGGQVRSEMALGPGEILYATNEKGRLLALNGLTGGVLFSRQLGESPLTSPRLDDKGHLFVASLDGNLSAVDAQSGAVRWVFESGAEVVGSPVVDQQGHVFLATKSGRIFALDPSRLDELVARVAAEPTDSPTVVKLEKDHLVVGGVRVKRKS